MAEKRYYWLKLQEDFFRQTAIKKLRRMAGGDTFTVIYLEMQLLSLKRGGELIFEHLEDDFSKEIALSLDEDADNVAATVDFLTRNNLLEVVEVDSYILPEVLENIGSEGASAKRARKYREKLAASQNGENVTVENRGALQCNEGRERALHCNEKTRGNKPESLHCNGEERREEEKREDIEEMESREPPAAPPTVEDVEAYCKANGLHIDAGHFVRHFEAGGWFDSKGRKVVNWRQKALEWE